MAPGAGWRRRVGRVLSRAALLLALVVVLAGGLLAAALWHTLPPDRAIRRVPGLGQPVDIAFGPYGIPRIHAASAEDAAAALGMLHARDRMFQMELMRRLGSGRLSEIAGPAALPTDRMMRILGLRVRAEAAWRAMPAHPRALLAAYARGVNAEITARGRFIAPEFLLLGRPAPWTPVDSLLWGRLMALSLGANWRTELARLAASPRVPLARQLALRPAPATALPPQALLALPDPASAPALGPSAAPGLVRLAAALDRALPRFPAPYTQPGEASDEWAVDGAHSRTGAPLLAGDPHLALGFPAIWYLARIEEPGFVLTGATAPGVPFLVLGQNGRIAWSMTSNEADTQDLFIEKEGPGQTYLTPPGLAPPGLAPSGTAGFALRREVIHVRGGADDILTVRESRHGPVISDALPQEAALGQGEVLALAWTALAPTDGEHQDPATSLIALDEATTTAAAGEAAGHSLAPVQNLLVADRRGIALYTTGTVPRRRAGDGSFPQPGWDGAHDWTGLASGDSLPHVTAPASGHLLNGNERTAPPDFPVFMGRDWPGAWRAQRIRALLEARPLHDVDEFVAMQHDTLSRFAADLLPGLLQRLAAHPPDGFSARAAAELVGWDGSMSARAPQPLIFNAWLQEFARDMLARNQVGQSITGDWPDFVALLLRPEGARFCGGDCTPALLHALDDSTARIALSQGNAPADWRWWRPHRAIFANPFLSRVPIVRRAARASVPVAGDETTLLRAGDGVLGRFSAIHGAAYRGVYDLADPGRSRFIVTPGQSGNWLSSTAWNLMQNWAAGTSITIPGRPETVRATVRLTP